MDESNRAMAPEAEPRPAGLAARAVAFDVDDASLASLQLALPGWEIEQIRGATAAALVYQWKPSRVDLFVVGVRNVWDSLGLCRFLAGCDTVRTGGQAIEAPPMSSPQLNAKVLALLPADQRNFVTAVLKAGAHSCLMLPIHPKDVASMLVHAQQGNQPGRHTLNLERAQKEDPWRDNGGQG